jgi:hypothetical protein
LHNFEIELNIFTPFLLRKNEKIEVIILQVLVIFSWQPFSFGDDIIADLQTILSLI